MVHLSCTCRTIRVGVDPSDNSACELSGGEKGWAGGNEGWRAKHQDRTISLDLQGGQTPLLRSLCTHTGVAYRTSGFSGAAHLLHALTGVLAPSAWLRDAWPGLFRQWAAAPSTYPALVALLVPETAVVPSAAAGGGSNRAGDPPTTRSSPRAAADADVAAAIGSPEARAYACSVARLRATELGSLQETLGYRFYGPGAGLLAQALTHPSALAFGLDIAQPHATGLCAIVAGKRVVLAGERGFHAKMGRRHLLTLVRTHMLCFPVDRCMFLFGLF